MSTRSKSRDRRIRQLIAAYLKSDPGLPQISREEFVSLHPDLAPRLEVELRRAEMLVGIRNNIDSSPPEPGARGEGRLRVTCPECNSSITIEPDDSWSGIKCGTCNTRFSLVDAAQDPDPVEEFVGHFELLGEIGFGAFGTVWRAYDRHLHRMAALKIPRKGQLTTVETDQFLREARAGAQLNHPNIVRVFEVGRQNDRVFIASEFIEGQTLARAMVQQQYASRESAALICKLAKAVHHAHDAGVIHRDLKPGNILMDEDGQPHIADFGLAKRDSGDITMTTTGAVIGTPAYMSPEQATGRAHQCDRRTDIYALGVILFRLLTGELPFRGTTAALLNQVINDEPPSPRKFNNRIPRDLETICLKCLQKNPDDRFKTAVELAVELERFLRGEPIVSRPVGSAGRIVRWSRRRPALAGALALALGIFVVGTVVAVALSIEAARESRKAAAAIEMADRRTYAADMNRVQQAMARGNRIEALGLLRKYLPSESSADKRQIEWHYWWQQCNQGSLGMLKGSARNFCVAVSPDGNSVVWGNEEGDVFFGAASFDSTNCLRRSHSQRVTDINFSPDGKQFISCGADGSLITWSPDETRPVRVDSIENGAGLWHCSFWNDGKWIVTGTESKGSGSTDEVPTGNSRTFTIRVVDCESGTVIDQLSFNGFYPWLSLSSDNSLLACGDSAIGKPAQLRNVKTGETRWSLARDNCVFGQSLFTLDGSKLICCFSSFDPPARDQFLVIDVATGAEERKVDRREGTAGIGALRFSRDGRKIAVATGEGTIDLYDAVTLQWRATLAGHDNRVSDLSYVTPDDTFFSVSDDGSLRHWTFDLVDNPLRISTGHIGLQLQFGNDGYMLYGSSSGRLTGWNRHNGDESVSYEGSFFTTAYAVDAETDTTYHLDPVDSHADQPGVQLIKAERFSNPSLIGLYRRPFISVQCLPDGNLLLAEGHSTQFSLDCPAAMVLVSPDTGEILREFGGREAIETHHMTVSDRAISPDSTRLASCSRDRTVRVWDYQSGEHLYMRKRPNTINPIYSVAISSTGILATGEADGMILFRDLESGDEVNRIYAHDQGVSFIQFTADGATLISGSADATLKFWDTESGQLRTELASGGVPFKSFAFSNDERFLAASDEDGRITVWNLSPE